MLVILADGDIYLANEFVEDFKLIEEEGTVELVSINNNHTKVAFKRDNENIQIYDIASDMIIDEVPNSASAFWFDFHANNETVYFYSSWLLKTYGPEVLLNNPTDIMNLSPISGSSVYIKGVVILENGNIIYSIDAPGAGARLYLSDGVTNLANSVFSNFRKNLRLNEAEDALWTASEYNNKLHIHNTATLEEEDVNDDFFIGSPINFYNGYKVLGTNKKRIYYPLSSLGDTWVSSPDGKSVTALDY